VLISTALQLNASEKEKTGGVPKATPAIPILMRSEEKPCRDLYYRCVNCNCIIWVDWKKAERITLANLKPSVKTISLRLPEAMLEELKLLANKRDIPYQSLVKVFLSDRIEQELTAKGHNKSLHRIAKKTGFR